MATAKDLAKQIASKVQPAKKRPTPATRPATRPTPASSPTPATKPKPNAISELEDPKNFKGLGNVWYDAGNQKHWRQSDKGEWVCYSDTQFTRFLKANNYDPRMPKYGTISPLDEMMVRLQHHRRLDFAGTIAGYQPGLYKICGQRILIVKGPQLPTPAAGAWEQLKGIFTQLLGPQLKYFYGWLKCALESLRAGPPFRPGQMLVLAGIHDSGKSLLQNLLTPILGGRVCKPYAYLIGEDKYSGELLGCEHWAIEDEASSTDIRSRRNFGAMIKNCVANRVQQFRAMYAEPIAVTPCYRLTMTLNCTPESLMVMPPHEPDVFEKIILCKVSPVDLGPRVSTSIDAYSKLTDRLEREIPAFVHSLGKWRIPQDLVGRRYGIKSYHHPDLVAAIDGLSPELRLLELIDTTDFFNFAGETFEGSAFDVRKRLMQVDRQGEARKLLEWSSSCGIFLAKLAVKCPSRVKILKTVHNVNRYAIIPMRDTP